MDKLTDRLRDRLAGRDIDILAANPFETATGNILQHPIDADRWIIQADDDEVALVSGDAEMVAVLLLLPARRLDIAIGAGQLVSGATAAGLLSAFEAHFSSLPMALVSRHSAVLKRQVGIRSAVSAAATAHGRLAAARRLDTRAAARRVDILAPGAAGTE